MTKQTLLETVKINEKTMPILDEVCFHELRVLNDIILERTTYCSCRKELISYLNRNVNSTNLNKKIK